MDMQPFAPHYGVGQVVTPAAAAADAAPLNADDQVVVVTNLGTNIAYVRIAASGPATVADYPVPPNGGQVPLKKGIGETRLSHISAAGSTLHIITGNGW